MMKTETRPGDDWVQEHFGSHQATRGGNYVDRGGNLVNRRQNFNAGEPGYNEASIHAGSQTREARQSSHLTRLKAEESWRTPGPYAGRGPRNYRPSDEHIYEAVCSRLSVHGGLDATGIEVFVQEGEVTLSGEAPSRRAKRLAEDLAGSVSGVKDVHNELRLRQRQA